MKQIAFAVLVIGVLFVVAQLVGGSEPETEGDAGDRDTTFDGVRY